MLSVGSLHEEAQLCKESTTPPPSVDILIVFGDRPSGFSDRGLASRVEGNQNPIPTSWEQVLLHLGEKVNWEAKESGRWDIAWRVDTESSFLHTPKPADIILGFGLEDPKWSAVALHELQDVPRVVMFFDCVKFVDGLAQVGAYRPTSVTSQLQAWFLPGQTRKDKDTYSLCQQLFGRRTTEDLLYSILVLINAFFVPLPFVDKTMKSDLPQQREIIKTCQKQLVACAKSPECRKTLQCLLRCAQNDQVCTYRCITSYENEAFANFALCILHRNNILGLNATIPVYPQLTAMQTFRGEALTWNSAETILRGWLGPEASSTASYFIGALSTVGGIIGYAKAGSKPSLIAGTGIGLLYFASGFYRYPLGSIATSTLLCTIMIPRFLRTRAFMPAGLLSVAGLANGAYQAMCLQ